MTGTRIAVLASVALSLATVAGSGQAGAATAQAIPSSVMVAPGYAVTVFARAPGKAVNASHCDASAPKCYTKPDSIVQLGAGAKSTIFVAYQGGLRPDGAVSAANSTIGKDEIVQYDLNGKMLKSYAVQGHNDGMMVHDSRTIWAMSDEDANPMLTVIDAASGTMKTYAADSAPAHGGGLDDMQMIDGVVYASGSNPALDPASKTFDKGAAVYALSLNTDGKTFHLDPVLAGNAKAHVINADAVGVNVDSAGNATLGNPLVPNTSTVNPGGLQDPDSMAIDPSGNLVLDSQADSELVFVNHPGKADQSAKELFLTLYSNPWPVDDTRWAPTSSKFMLVTDSSAGLIYKVTAASGFKAGSMYSAGEGTVLRVNATTGEMAPVAVGMASPHGILFVR